MTEFLASKCKIKDRSEVMLINNKKLSVCPITTHIDIKQVSKQIHENLILKKFQTLTFGLVKNLKENQDLQF